MIKVKSKVIVMSKCKYLKMFSFAFILLITICGTCFKGNYEKNSYNNIQIDCQSELPQVTMLKKSPIEEFKSNNIIKNKLEIQEIEGINVIGKLEIPKIDLATYILENTSEATLNKSVTKLCGPKVNGVGNLCITGHNYHNDKMFGDLKKVELQDKIYVTGTNGIKIEYVVYDIETVYPKEVECLSQDTNHEREITLITCTTGAIKRLIVKATEVYD